MRPRRNVQRNDVFLVAIAAVRLVAFAARRSASAIGMGVALLGPAAVQAADSGLGGHFELQVLTEDNANRGADDAERRYDALWGMNAGLGEDYYLGKAGNVSLVGGFQSHLSRYRGMSRLAPFGYLDWSKGSSRWGSVIVGANVAYETWSLHPARDGWRPKGLVTYVKNIYSKEIGTQRVVEGLRVVSLRLHGSVTEHRTRSKDELEKEVFDTRLYEGSVALRVYPVWRSGPLRWMDTLHVEYAYRAGDFISSSSPSAMAVEAAKAAAPDIAFDPEPENDPFAPPPPPSDSTAFRIEGHSHFVSATVASDLGGPARVWFNGEHEIIEADPRFRATVTRFGLGLIFSF